MATNPRLIMEGLKTILNNSSNLADPYETAGGKNNRTWWHTDAPLLSATYPRGQIKKSTATTEIIDLGYDEWKTGIFMLYFYTKDGFTVTVDGTKLKNERLCEYYATLIEDALRTNRDDIDDIWGLKVSVSDEPIFLPGEKLHAVALTVRIFYFNIS